MTLYNYVLCYTTEKQKKLEHYKKLRNISYTIYAVCVVVCMALPLQTEKGYAIGPAVNFVYLCSTICINVWFIPMIKNRKIIEYKKVRLNKQPYDMPNAGSVFKNPINNFAGKLIESLSLRGYNIGDAMVSKKHANFIVNKGNATGKEIVKLIEYIKEKVKNKYDIDLELEQEIID